MSQEAGCTVHPSDTLPRTRPVLSWDLETPGVSFVAKAKAWVERPGFLQPYPSLENVWYLLHLVLALDLLHLRSGQKQAEQRGKVLNECILRSQDLVGDWEGRVLTDTLRAGASKLFSFMSFCSPPLPNPNHKTPESDPRRSLTHRSPPPPTPTAPSSRGCNLSPHPTPGQPEQ